MNQTPSFPRHEVARAIGMAFGRGGHSLDEACLGQHETHGACVRAQSHPAPALWLVHKSPLGCEIKFAQNISLNDSMLLAGWHTAKTPTDEQKCAALSIMRTACQRKWWIACGCRAAHTDYPDQPPVLVVVDLGKDHYTLRRLSGRTTHAHGCPFRLDKKDGFQTRDDDIDTGVPAKGEPDLLRGRLSGDGRVHQPAENHREKGKATRTKADVSLHGALRHLMSLSGRSQITPMRSYSGELTAIMQAAGEIRHRKSEELSLAHCMLVDPPDPGASEVLYMLFAMSDGLWPPNELPVGYILLVADSIEKHEDGRCAISPKTTINRANTGGVARTKIQHTPFTPDCQIRVAEIQGAMVEGPYLVMLRAEKDFSGQPIWIEGIAHPIVSRTCWVPVRSNPEREAHEVLQNFSRELERVGVKYDIHVVLECMRADKGDPCWPDFFVRRLDLSPPARPLLVETQKTSDPVYHTRKERLHQTMQDIGTLVIDDRLTCDRQTADKLLLSHLRRYFDRPDHMA